MDCVPKRDGQTTYDLVVCDGAAGVSGSHGRGAVLRIPGRLELL